LAQGRQRSIVTGSAPHPVCRVGRDMSLFGGGGFFGGGDGGGFFAHDVPGGRFDHQYNAFPVTFIGKEELEKGNKIILPQSALDALSRLHISYPMLFEVTNPSQSRKTHCGVQEFIAEEGTCYLPYWMMCNLLLSEGELVRVTNTSLPKGRFVKLQPVSSDFLTIHNPRAVLENAFRNFATLSVGDCIVINYNQNKYEIEVIECKPANAISIIEADVSVDFAEPKFNKDPEPLARGAATQSSSSAFKNQAEELDELPPPLEPASSMFAGQGQRVDGKPIKAPSASPALGPSPAPKVDEHDSMPWKNRIPGGIKWTKKPYGFGMGHMTTDKAQLAAEDPELFKGSGQTLM